MNSQKGVAPRHDEAGDAPAALSPGAGLGPGVRGLDDPAAFEAFAHAIGCTLLPWQIELVRRACRLGLQRAIRPGPSPKLVLRGTAPTTTGRQLTAVIVDER